MATALALEPSLASAPDGASRYLQMAREVYAGLVARSDYSTEHFTTVETAEHVVGAYALHERYDYERWLLGGVTLGSDATALEYGCGPGRMLLRFARRFHRVDGVDISPELVAVARRRVEAAGHRSRIWTTPGDGLSAEATTPYDVAYSVICLQHICVYSIRRRIFEALFDVLRPGGLLTFQMGYGPGHGAMVGYHVDEVGVRGTNGAVDVTVLHPGQLEADLRGVGFHDLAYALTPTGPGDTHGAWIFVRALKPGTGAALSTSQARWKRYGFTPLISAPEDVERAISLQHERGLFKRCTALAAHARQLDARAADATARLTALQASTDRLRQEHAALGERAAALGERTVALTATVDALQTRLSATEAAVRTATDQCAALERKRVALEDERAAHLTDASDLRQAHDAWRERAAEWQAARDHATTLVGVIHAQLTALQRADRPRVMRLIDRHVETALARGWTIAVLGAGAHTEWLLRETTLAEVPGLALFDTHAPATGGRLCGRPVRPAAELPRSGAHVVILSSLAFQEEMARFVEALALADVHVVRCYP